MYFDVQNLLSDDQDISQTAGTYYSTNSLDLTATPRNIGAGELVKVYFQMTETLVGATATLAVALIESSDEGPPSADIVALKDTGALAVGTWVAGYAGLFTVPFTAIGQRYLSMRYTIATATTTAGLITAGIVWDHQTAFSDWTAETGR